MIRGIAPPPLTTTLRQNESLVREIGDCPPWGRRGVSTIVEQHQFFGSTVVIALYSGTSTVLRAGGVRRIDTLDGSGNTCDGNGWPEDIQNKLHPNAVTYLGDCWTGTGSGHVKDGKLAAAIMQ